ncbi:MAG: hypothetical protein ACREKI_09015 [Gemmatimonadota bacterium]
MTLRSIAPACVALALIAPACATGGTQAALAPECGPAGPARMVGADAAGLAGEYSLTLVAEQGPFAGRAVRGNLWLRPNPPEWTGIPSPAGGMRTDASAPLYGATDVDVEAVGALRLGDPTSPAPEAPGVLVVESGEQVILRVGSEANRRDVQRFDGGYLALFVKRITPDGFAGGWASGLLGAQAEGYFCARRVRG